MRGDGMCMGGAAKQWAPNQLRPDSRKLKDLSEPPSELRANFRSYGDSPQRPGRGNNLDADADDNWHRQPPDRLDLPDSPPSAGSGHGRGSVHNEQRGAGARSTLHLTPMSTAAAGVGGAAAGPSPGGGVPFVVVV